MSAEPTERTLALHNNGPSILAIIQGVLERGVTSENVDVMERLMQLKRDEDGARAKREFAAAFVALQKVLPPIRAEKIVPNKDGSQKYVYAPYEVISAQVRPVMLEHGFSVRFSSAYREQEVTVTCHLMHTGGHTETNDFTCRAGEGPYGSNASQKDGAALTYATRFAFCAALGIVIQKDTDARALGAQISPAKASELRQRVKTAGRDESAFLRFAGATSFETIHDGKLATLERELDKAERKASRVSGDTAERKNENGEYDF